MRNPLTPLILAASLAGALPALSHAKTIVTTSEADFRGRLSKGSETITFDNDRIPSAIGLWTYHAGPYTVLAGALPGYLLTYETDDGAGGRDTSLTTYYAGDTLTLSFQSGSPRAVGGYFFLSPLSSQVDRSLNLRVGIGAEGTFVDVPYDASLNARNFLGFLSDAPIQVLTVQIRGIVSPSARAWGFANDLILGQPIVTPPDVTPPPRNAPVPEPSTLASAAVAALAGLLAVRRGRRARVRGLIGA